MKQKTPTTSAASAQNKTYSYSAYDTRHVERLLACLDRVFEKGPDSWRASCPTAAHPHGDRSAGLSIDTAEDGRILLYCPAGCHAEEICGAIGMELRDLFPPKPFHNGHRPPAGGLSYAERKKLSNALHTEELVIKIFDEDRANGLPMDDDDRERVGIAMAYAAKFRRALGVGS